MGRRRSSVAKARVIVAALRRGPGWQPRRRGGVRLTATVVMGVACCGLAPATTEPMPFDFLAWTFDGQAYLYDSSFARTPGSPLNPGNSYVRLPNVALTGELRPNAKAVSDVIDLVLQPRLSSVFQTGGVPDQESVRGFINQGYVRVKPADDVSFTVGREYLAWGPAILRSPSNPYYFNNQRMDPFVELSGVDLARVSYSPRPHWNLSGGIIFDSGHALVADDAYRQSLLLKADYINTDYLASLIVASRRRQSTFFGGYAQATINSATLAYAEVGASSAERGLGVVDTAGGAVFSPGVGNHRSATALVGGSYTLENGQTAYLEYLYNGFGYTRRGLYRYFTEARLSGSQTLLGGSLGALGVAGTGEAAERAQDLLGQHYLYLQYQNSPTEGDRLWRLMLTQNLVDHSTQLGCYLEQSLTGRISLFALGLDNIGPKSSDFGSIFRFGIIAGFKAFLF